MKIRTLIVDDETLARRLIHRLLASHRDFEVVGECADGRDAVATIERLAPELVFLDVQMPEGGGFEVLRLLDAARAPAIVFVTAYDQYALRAFQAHALDYLLKPVDEERFTLTLTRVKTYLNGRQHGALRERLADLISELPAPAISRLAVKTGGRVIFLKMEDVSWIEASGNYLELHVGKECHLLRGRLSELEKRLKPEQFFRIHRSTIVNLDQVTEFRPLFKGEGVVVLKDGSRLSASRSCSQKLQEFLDARL